MRIPGRPFLSLENTNLQECAKRCNEEKPCRSFEMGKHYWVQHPTIGLCHLKNSTNFNPHPDPVMTPHGDEQYDLYVKQKVPSIFMEKMFEKHSNTSNLKVIEEHKGKDELGCFLACAHLRARGTLPCKSFHVEREGPEEEPICYLHDPLATDANFTKGTINNDKSTMYTYNSKERGETFNPEVEGFTRRRHQRLLEYEKTWQFMDELYSPQACAGKCENEKRFNCTSFQINNHFEKSVCTISKAFANPNNSVYDLRTMGAPPVLKGWDLYTRY